MRIKAKTKKQLTLAAAVVAGVVLESFTGLGSIAVAKATVIVKKTTASASVNNP